MSSLNQYFKVDVYSHFFKITRIDPRGRVAVENFAREFVQYGMKKEGRRWIRAPMKVFGSRTRNYSEYRFHINQYDKFLKSLDYQDVPKHTYEIEKHEADAGDDVDIDVLPHWELRAHQPAVVAYLESPEPTLIKLVEVQTGYGKTMMSLWATAKRKKRFMVSIRPMYIDKWVEDVKKVCGIERHEVAVVQGSSQLMEIIALGRHGLNERGIKAVIISNKTLQLWYSLYEVEGAGVLDMGYDCLPDELCNRLGIGTRIIDEVHQDFHLNFKVDLYTNVSKSISLSATLKADDPFLNRMYEVTYPKATRFSGLEYKRYANTFAVLYRIHQPGKIKTTQWGSPNYSHHAFESSIIKSPAHLSSYLEMIVAIAKRFHFQEYVPGDRLLVYCASIELCTIVTDYLKVEYPKLDVRRYVEDDPYENVMEADVCVSTLLSAGTGVDIAMLTTVILTTAISSTQSNVQGKGRLREIPGRQTRFAYFTCLDIPKHMQYHQKKTEILKEMAKIHQEYSYPLIVGR